MKITSLDKTAIINAAMAVDAQGTIAMVEAHARTTRARADRAEDGFEGARANEFAIRHMLERLVSEYDLDLTTVDLNKTALDDRVNAVYKRVSGEHDAAHHAAVKAGDIRMYYGSWVKYGTWQYKVTISEGQTNSDGKECCSSCGLLGR